MTMTELLNPEMQPFLIGMILGLVFAAFFSFRLLKLEIVIMGASVGYSLGSVELAALVGDAITGVNIGVILGVVCAILCAILSVKLYKLCVFISGGIVGYGLGTALFPSLVDGFGVLPIEPELLVTIMSAVVAIILAFVIYKIFKPFYIIITSIASMFLAGSMAAMLLFNGDETAIGVGAMVGLVLGVFAMVKQFKMNAGRTL